MPCWNRMWLVSASREAAALLVILLIAASASAQPRGRWQIEFHVGGGPSINSKDATTSFPTPGATFTTVVGTPSRRASSWYFGDGALLLNQVSAALGISSRITPLDSVFATSLIDRHQGAIVGFRATRSVTPRFSAEFSIDYALARLEMSGPALAGIEAARASFVPAFNGLISTGPFPGSSVTSVSTIHETGGRQVFATGALTINFETSRRARTIPYISIGGGVKVHVGETPSASLEGNYQFQILGVQPVREIDRVTIRGAVHNSAVGLVGGGFKRVLTRRLGVRFDLRALVSNGSTETLLDTRSSPGNGTPTGATASITTPSVQFSNNGTAGLSSLGGQINGFRIFEGRGLQTQTDFTAGLFLMF